MEELLDSAENFDDELNDVADDKASKWWSSLIILDCRVYLWWMYLTVDETTNCIPCCSIILSSLVGTAEKSLIS